MNSLSRKCAWSLLLFGGCGSVMATDAVVSSCNESAFTSAFNTVNSSGAGTITFSCSGSIVFTGYKQVSGNVVIDGGANAITFDGGGTSAFFQVYASGALTLKKLTLTKGGLNGAHPVESFGLLTLDQVTATLNSVPGSVVYSSGTALIRPDFPELKHWPFFWQQTEYVLGRGTTDYLLLVLAADHVLNQPRRVK